MIFDELMSLKFEKQPEFKLFWFKDVNPHSQRKKKRQVAAPSNSMRVIHARLLRYIREMHVALPSSMSCARGSSPFKNVLFHKKNRYFYLLDLHNAYGSVRTTELTSVFCDIDPSLLPQREIVENFFKRFCINDSGQGLITGAPASPDLFNIYGEYKIDWFIRQMLEKFTVTYTRYLDDLTFSSPYPINSLMRKEIREIVEKAGFKVNNWKSEVLDIHKKSIVITGLGLERGGRIFVPRHVLREVRGLLHLALEGAPISRHVINGKMSPLIFLAKKCRQNSTERKLLQSYGEFRRSSKNRKGGKIKVPKTIVHQMPKWVENL